MKVETPARPPVTLALLPLENLSKSEEDQLLARGFLQDLSAELARFPALGVIAAESVLALRREDQSALALGSKLGATCLLQGSLRRNGAVLRISLQLLEAKSGHHLWAGRYDEENPQLIQDEVAAKVANALAISMDQSLLRAARVRRVTSLKAYECWLRGMECLQRGVETADREARKFFDQALEIDPGYARGFAGISLSHFNDWSCQAWEKWETKEALAYESAVRAEALDPDDAVVQLILARIEQYRREFERAKPRLDRALQLAPNDANVLIQLTGGYTFHGEPGLGWELAQRSLDLNPLCPGWYYVYAAMPLYSLGRYEEALTMAAKAPPKGILDVPAYKAAALGQLGRRKETAAYLSEFREDFVARISRGKTPGDAELFRWIQHVNPYRRREDIDRLSEGLTLAGLRAPDQHPAGSDPLHWPIANIFRREGELWTLSFDHVVVQMAERRGLYDLARLLGQPQEEIASAELAELGLHASGIEKVDKKALLAYRQRLREIDEEMEAAEAADDSGRAEKLVEEREGLLREIGAATGLRGRLRKSNDVTEKARTAVTWRIRSAIRKITAAHPALGRHLENSVRTGAFCSYQPEQPTVWQV